MKLFRKNRYDRLKNELDRLRRFVGEQAFSPPEEDLLYFFDPFRRQKSSLAARIERLEEENRLLRDYLKVKIHVEEARRFYAKIIPPKIKKTRAQSEIRKS